MSLIKTIEFEIHDFTNHVSEEFLIEFTEENYAAVLAHRFTRQIRIAKAFDFQFEKDMRMPVEFIDYRVWLALLPEIEDAVLIEELNEVLG